MWESRWALMAGAARIVLRSPTPATAPAGARIAPPGQAGRPEPGPEHFSFVSFIATPPAEVAKADVIVPMTSAQQEIWGATRFGPEASSAFNLSRSLRLSGPFNLGQFQAALNELACRHDALRATPDERGETQVVRPALTLPCVVEDLAPLPAAAQAARLEAAARECGSTPFDLAHGPLARCQVLRVAPDDHLVILTAHQLIADAWSCELMLRELGELYGARREGRAVNLPPAARLADAVAALDHAERRRARDKASAYWRDLYVEGLARVDLPSDRPRPSPRRHEVERIDLPVEPALTEALTRLAEQNDATLLDALVGGFAAYLTRLTGAADLPVAFSAPGGVLPLRMSCDLQHGFADHLRRTARAMAAAQRHGDLDLPALMHQLQPQREINGQALIPIGLRYAGRRAAPTFGDLQAILATPAPAYGIFDLDLTFVETETGLRLEAVFSTALFERSTLEGRLGEYARLLAAAARDPDAPIGTLEMMAPDDRRRLLAEGGGVAADYPRDASLVELFKDVVGRHGGKTALLVAARPGATLPDRRVSYDELDQLSDAWAARLQQTGVKPGDLVAVATPRSLDLIVGLLAVLKAGAAYVPIAPTMPAAGVQRILDHSEAAALLTHSTLPKFTVGEGVAVLEMDQPQADSPAFVAPGQGANGGDPVYVIYTSGSTGVPKGVVVPHRGISRLVLSTDYTPLDETRVLLLLAPASFDISMFEIWGALLNGAKLVVPPWDQMPDLTRLGDILKATRVSTLQMTPALFNTIIDEAPDILDEVEELMIGGEALSAPHVHRALQHLPNINLINVYGPTENAVWSTYYRIPRDFDGASSSVPIGRPIHNGQAYIVDDRLQLVLPGAAGELVCGGDGVALEYLKQPELSARMFVADTVTGAEGARLYRTGDYCRRLPSGEIEFIGRRDNQIKIRGFRIELGEVEAALMDLPGVRKAAVVHEPGPDGGHLCAFVVGADASVTEAWLTQALRERLARHLVPTKMRVLDELPLSVNGKLDRKALAATLAVEQAEVRDVAPASDIETALVEIWSDVLQRKVTSVEETFFDLGGHSLMAIRLFDRIWRRFNVDLPIATLFAHPTIRDLAALIERQQTPAAGASAAFDPTADWDTTVVTHAGPGGQDPAVFIVAGMGGNVNSFVDLSARLGRRRKVVGIQIRGVMGHDPRETIEDIAAENIRYIRNHQPKGPYVLVGYSAGAYTAFEMARQLSARGERVAQLVLLDTHAPGADPAAIHVKRVQGAARVIGLARYELGKIRQRGLRHVRWRVSSKISNLTSPLRERFMVATTPLIARSVRAANAMIAAADRYEGGAYDGPTTLVVAPMLTLRDEEYFAGQPYLGWDRIIDPARIARLSIEANHFDMLKGRHAETLANLIERSLDGPPQTT